MPLCNAERSEPRMDCSWGSRGRLLDDTIAQVSRTWIAAASANDRRQTNLLERVQPVLTVKGCMLVVFRNESQGTTTQTNYHNNLHCQRETEYAIQLGWTVSPVVSEQILVGEVATLLLQTSAYGCMGDSGANYCFDLHTSAAERDGDVAVSSPARVGTAQGPDGESIV
eukprot:3603125-Amphidinium_carterae.1